MKGKRPDLKAVAGGLLNAPPMPDTLPAEMAMEWSTIAADLIGRKLFTPSMLTLLETFVGAVWMARQCRNAIAEVGPLVRNKDGALRPNPAASMLAKANETVARLGYEMGISAAGRNLPAVKNHTGSPDEDDLVALGL